MSMFIPKVESQSTVQPPTQPSTQTGTQQPLRENPPGDSITPKKSSECCFVTLWNAICKFFKWICPCLCGRSNKESKPDGTGTKPDGTKPNAEQQPLDRTAVITAGADFISSYDKYMNSKEDYQMAVKAFAELQPQVQWQVLHLLLPREKFQKGEDMPLGFISTYVAASEKIEKEVCKGLGIDSVNRLRDKKSGLKNRNLRKDLCIFLKRKAGIEDPAPSNTEPSEALRQMYDKFLTKNDENNAAFKNLSPREKVNVLIHQLSTPTCPLGTLKSYLYLFEAEHPNLLIVKGICKTCGLVVEDGLRDLSDNHRYATTAFLINDFHI